MGFSRVELLQAVLAVLGADACDRPERREPADDNHVAVALRVVVDAGLPVDAAVVTISPSRDASSICAEYEKSTRRKTKPSAPKPRVQYAAWDPNEGVAICLIPRELREGLVAVTHTVRCCGNPNCVQASMMLQVQGTTLVTEHARLRGDGTLVDTGSYSTISETFPPREHVCG
jgi:hypothetical protein